MQLRASPYHPRQPAATTERALRECSPTASSSRSRSKARDPFAMSNPAHCDAVLDFALKPPKRDEPSPARQSRQNAEGRARPISRCTPNDCRTYSPARPRFPNEASAPTKPQEPMLIASRETSAELFGRLLAALEGAVNQRNRRTERTHRTATRRRNLWKLAPELGSTAPTINSRLLPAELSGKAAKAALVAARTPLSR